MPKIEPPGWVRPTEEQEIDPYQAILGVQDSAPGTKARLRDELVSAGWDSILLDSVLNEKFQGKNNIQNVVSNTSYDIKAFTKLCKDKGFPLTHTEKTSPEMLVALWESLTVTPYWLGLKGTAKTVVLLAPSRQLATKVTASFIYDLYAVHGTTYMPSFKRYAALTWASPEALLRLPTTYRSDIAVVYGGLDDQESVYQTMSYFAAMSEHFPGIMLYEGTYENSADLDVAVTAAKRAGVSHIFRVGAA